MRRSSHFPGQFTTVMQGSICSAHVHVCLHWILYTLCTLSLYLHYLCSMGGQQKGTIFHSKHHETFSCQTGRTTCSSCLPYQRESIIRRAYRIMIPASSKPTSFVRAEKTSFVILYPLFQFLIHFRLSIQSLLVVHRIQSCPAFALLIDYEPK